MTYLKTCSCPMDGKYYWGDNGWHNLFFSSWRKRREPDSEKGNHESENCQKFRKLLHLRKGRPHSVPNWKTVCQWNLYNQDGLGTRPMTLALVLTDQGFLGCSPLVQKLFDLVMGPQGPFPPVLTLQISLKPHPPLLPRSRVLWQPQVSKAGLRPPWDFAAKLTVLEIF